MGNSFSPYVQRSLALLDEGAAVLEQMAGNLPQVAKLGYFHSISASLIPALVEGLPGGGQPEHPLPVYRGPFL